MKHDHHLRTEPSAGYELLDSGENMKLERFGEVVVARPETQALWAKMRPELWKNAHATFAFGAKSSWDVRKELPEPWLVPHGAMTLSARLTSFKHTGIFPEQAPNWVWTQERIRTLKDARREAPRVLNLFGYTGAASVSAALAAKTAKGGSPDDLHSKSFQGAHVTHVDSSKQSLDWARKNAELSHVPSDAIRWIPDDALAFAKREARRGAKYDGIILDPPAFGRGVKAQVWRIEEDLPKLLAMLKELLEERPGSFFLLNGYAAGYASRSFTQAVESTFGKIDGESGELLIKETSTDRVIPAGIYVRFTR